MADAKHATDRRPGETTPVLIVANGNPLSRRTDTVARAVLRQLRVRSGARVDLVTTGYAGHARRVAEEWAIERPDGVIVGVGGDGTLNEIANGILAATAACSSRTALAVCPAGNANDQYRSWPRAERSRVEDVTVATPVPVDVLELSYRKGATAENGRRYALSYVAIGVVATAASVVNDRRRHVLANVTVIPRTLRRARPVTVAVENEAVVLDSLSWHIVPTMAKFLRVSSNAQRDDGLMEVVVVPHRRGSTWLRISWLAARALVGLREQRQRASMSFHWEDGGMAELDGETVDVPPGSDVTVRCVPAAIRMHCCVAVRAR